MTRGVGDAAELIKIRFQHIEHLDFVRILCYILKHYVRDRWVKLRFNLGEQADEIIAASIQKSLLSAIPCQGWRSLPYALSLKDLLSKLCVQVRINLLDGMRNVELLLCVNLTLSLVLVLGYHKVRLSQTYPSMSLLVLIFRLQLKYVLFILVCLYLQLGLSVAKRLGIALLNLLLLASEQVLVVVLLLLLLNWTVACFFL